MAFRSDISGQAIDGEVARPSSAWWALVGLSLSMVLSSLGTSVANVALPTLARVYGGSFQNLQWVVLAYLLAITTLIVSVGRLGDLLGRRRLLIAGVAVFTAGSVLCGVAPTLGVLIAARALQGLGAAVMMTLSLAFVAGTVPKASTGSAMGLLGTMSALGTALGPTLGGALIAGFGWRSVFLINLPLGVLTIWIARRHLPREVGRGAEIRSGFDPAGSLLLALTLGAYALAMTTGQGNFSLVNGLLLALAAMGCVLLVRVEVRTRHPLIPIEQMRNPILRAGLAMSALVTTVVMATLVVGPFYLSGALALDAARVGLVMSAGPIVAALAGVPAGRGVDRFGAQRTMVAGLIAMLLGTAALTAQPMSFGVPGYLVALVVITAGYAAFQAANNTAIMADVGAGQRGLIAGLLNLSRNLGLITGAAVMGKVFAVGAAATDIVSATAVAVAAGMRLTFAVAAVLIVVALLIARFGRNYQQLPLV